MVIFQCLFMFGCKSGQKTDQTPVKFNVDDLIERHNARAAKIEQLWSRVVLEAKWTDEKGHHHFEQGDGPMIVRKPHDLALSIGKLGETFYWLGCDADQFWLFEMHPPDDQPTTAYYGRFADFTQQAAAKLPIPLRPDRLIDLLGITALPADVTTVIPPVVDATGATFIMPLGDSPDDPQRGGRIYIRLDGRTALPEHVTITAPDGRMLLSAKLGKYQPMHIDNAPPGAFPDLPTFITVTSDEQNAQLTLHISDATDGRAAHRVKDAQFDFDTLLHAMNPKQVLLVTPKSPAAASEPPAPPKPNPAKP